jgi:Icc-related predicted phosphoesterase
MNTEEEIKRLENFIEEEQRCLDYCYSNPGSCDEGEVDERLETLDELRDELETLKQQH